jgi:hypothetical protein
MTSNDHDLIKFGRKNYTYINSFFGDITVRQIISELYPSKKLKLVAEQGTGEFEHSMHHVLFKNNEKICSVEQGCQNIGIKPGQDCNDTLCQSYSLLNYFIERGKEGKENKGIKLLYAAIPIRGTPYWKYEKQMMMINMYHQLINNEKFLNKLTHKTRGLPPPNDVSVWKDYTIMRYNYKGELKPYPQLKEKSYIELFESINELLEEWYEYGFYYYMNKGTKEDTDFVPEGHGSKEHRERIFPLNQPVLGKRNQSHSPSSSPSPPGKSQRRGGKRNKTRKKSCQKKRKSCKNVK